LPRPSRGWSGNWYLIGTVDDVDPLTQLENDKERVRLLLDRYGFINREVTNRDNLGSAAQRFRWRHAFRALRLMELAGEVLTGHFFEGLSTPQFITPTALTHLSANTPGPDSFWVAAHDPVSPCGLSLDWPVLPARRLGNYLSFVAGELALVVTQNGGELTYLIPWDDPGIDAANDLISHLVETRRQHLRVTVINGASARHSPYLAGLQRAVQTTADHKQVILQPSY
jgi:ATP-dependent Lhr-like helicase